MNVPFSPDALYSLISPAHFNGKPTDLREGEEEKCVFQSLSLFREQVVPLPAADSAQTLLFCSKGGTRCCWLDAQLHRCPAVSPL